MVNNQNLAIAENELTGKYLVLFREDAVTEGMQMLSDLGGINVSSSEQSQTGQYKLLNTLGVAVVSADLEQMRSLRISAAENNPILAIEPERVLLPQ